MPDDAGRSELPIDNEDVRKHLEFIQAVIARMSASSGLAKAWCLTVATGAFGYSLANESDAVAWLGLLAVVLFGLLDARYLREERKFRALYQDARLRRIEVYDMRPLAYSNRKNASFDPRCAWSSVLTSWSLWAFYGPIVVGAVFVVALN